MSTDDKTINWYNKNASEYTTHVRNPDGAIYHSLYEKPAMYALLPDLNNRKAISLGCGSGEDSHHLKLCGASESVGIDISKELATIATNSYPECNFYCMDMEKLNFPDESFDFAYSSLAIHYLSDWTGAFKEVYRVLKPNSSFLFSCNHPVMSAMFTIEDSDERKVRQLSITNFRESKTTEVIGNYLKKRAVANGAGDMEVTTWHKPFDEIFQEFKAAGFILDTFVEPKPLPKMESVSSQNFERLSKIPFFAILRLRKL
jgi:SAM-dependent methyltransferase